jgi:hypothetical protein
MHASDVRTVLRDVDGLLFQRPPWRVLAKILRLEPRNHLVAQSVAPIPGDFPVASVGAFILEAMGQSGLALLHASSQRVSGTSVVARISGFKWPRDLPAAVVDHGVVVEVKLVRVRESGFGLVRATIASNAGHSLHIGPTEILYKML